MACPRPLPAGRRRRFVRGHTLVELTVVILIAGVLSAVTVVSVRGLDSARQDIAAGRVRNALVYAQEKAVSAATTTWVVFRVSSDKLVVYIENPASPGRTNRLRLTDPLTRKDMVLNLTDSGGSITRADFGGTDEVSFDSVGMPMDEDGHYLTADGTVAMGGGGVVRVTKRTGLVTVE